MTEDTIDSLIEWLPIGSNVLLSGFGEPLLNKHLKKLVRGLGKKDISVSMITNGLLLGSVEIRALIDDGLREIQVSFPAIDEQIYSKMMPGADQQRVLDNLKQLSSYNSDSFCIRLNIVVDEANKDEIEELKELAKQLSMWPFIRRVHSRGGSISTSRPCTDIKACGIFASVTFIAWDGFIFTCSNDVKRKNCLGSIFDDDFQDIVNKKKKIISSNKWFPICSECNDDYRYLILYHGGVNFEP